MKNTASLMVPVLFILVGVYVLFTTFGSSGEEVALLGVHNIPRGLALVFGGLGLVGGGMILSTMISKHKATA